MTPVSIAGDFSSNDRVTRSNPYPKEGSHSCVTFPRHLGKQIARALIAIRVLDKKNVRSGFFSSLFEIPNGQEVTAAQTLLSTKQTSLTLQIADILN